MQKGPGALGWVPPQVFHLPCGLSHVVGPQRAGAAGAPAYWHFWGQAGWG